MNWPQDTIRELIALAQESGSSCATLTDASEAKLFRFAIYNFRRDQGIGFDLSITLDEEKVLLKRKELPEIKIVH